MVPERLWKRKGEWAFLPMRMKSMPSPRVLGAGVPECPLLRGSALGLAKGKLRVGGKQRCHPQKALIGIEHVCRRSAGPTCLRFPL